MSKYTDIHSCSYFCKRPACIKAQRDELRAKNEAHQIVFSGIASALAELHNMTPEQLDTLRKDAERLDWIAQQELEDLFLSFLVDHANHDGRYCVCGDSCKPGYGPTLRAAIDAAMNAGKPELQAPKTSAP